MIFPILTISALTLRPFRSLIGSFPPDRRHSAAVLSVLGSSWLPLVAQMASRRGPPTYGSQKLLMVFFSYCKRNKTGRPPKWSQKGILALMAAPVLCGVLGWSGLLWAALGLCLLLENKSYLYMAVVLVDI